VRYLLDTQLLLWVAANSPRLPIRVREITVSEGATLAFSVASIWEIAIKASLGRDDFVVNTSRLRSQLMVNEYTELAVTGLHALAVLDIPRTHGDPFDRMLLAQAMHEGMTLVTTDRVLATYPGPILKV
jgi:PIN domain nuclease of toxin-antitoxin system